MTALPFQQAEEFEAVLLARDFSRDDRRLLMLMHSAANGSPDVSIEGRYVVHPEPLYVMTCTEGQKRIAERCGFRSRSGDVDPRRVRHVCTDLERRRILVRRTENLPLGGSETQYYLSVQRLIDLPASDPSTPIGRAVAALALWSPFDNNDSAGHDNSFSVDRDNCDHVDPETVHNITAPENAVNTGGDPSGIPTGKVIGIPNGYHDHVHEHETKTHDHVHEHDHVSFRDSDFEPQSAERPRPQTGTVRFSDIKPEHIQRIVRHRDTQLFEGYFADAVVAKFAKDCEAERTCMAAIFHQVHRVGKAEIPGRVIAKVWQRRNDSDPRKRPRLAKEDEDFARLLIRSPSALPGPAAGPIVVAIKAPADEFASEALLGQSVSKREQQERLRRFTPVG